MARFHYNSATGQVNVCTAQIACPLGEENHVEGAWEQARAFQEEKETQVHGGIFPAQAVVKGVVRVSKALQQYRYYPEQAERDALALYVRNGYGAMNRHLRGEQETAGRPLEAIQELDSLFAKAPERKDAIEVYRVTNSWPNLLNEHTILDQPLQVKTFLSTSSDVNFLSKRKRPIHWILTVAPEVKAIDVNALGESNMVHESEILLARNSWLTVSEVRQKGALFEVIGRITAGEV